MRGTFAFLLLAAATGGCARGAPAANEVDVDAAALRAERNIANYASRRHEQPPLTPARASARYQCDGGLRLAVQFDNVDDTAQLRIADRDPVTMAGQRPASGIWYAGDGYVLRGKGDAAILTRPDGAAVPCRAG